MKPIQKYCVFAACLTLSVPASGLEKLDEKTEYGFAPDVGPLCVAALLSYGVAVGQKCLPEQEEENQRKLQETQALLDTFILSDPDWDEKMLTAFKKQQGGSDINIELLCKGDSMLIGKSYATGDQDALRSSIKDVIARYDKVSWGTCL